MNKIFVICTLALAAACSSEPVMRFEAPTEPVSERVRIAYSTVSIRDVSLPTYAESEEIPRQDAGGAVTTDSNALWADDPVRAITLDIARSLQEISGARVAPDPWPYLSRPEVVVDIRFEELLPGADGSYRAVGVYFVAPEDEHRRERARNFNLSVSYDAQAGFPALVQARGTLLKTLTVDIAQSALR